MYKHSLTKLRKTTKCLSVQKGPDRYIQQFFPENMHFGLIAFFLRIYHHNRLYFISQ